MGEMRDLGRYTMLPMEEKGAWDGEDGEEGRQGGRERGDDMILLKIKTLDNEKELDVDADGSWTIQQLKHHVSPAAHRLQPPRNPREALPEDSS